MLLAYAAWFVLYATAVDARQITPSEHITTGRTTNVSPPSLFVAVTTGDAVKRTDVSLGAVAFDADGDGDQDLFVANYGQKNELLLNDGLGNFTAVTTGDAVKRADNSTGAVALDADGDGDQDLYVANSYGQKNELLLNDGLGNFTTVTTGDAVKRADNSTGAVALDADGDGDQDLYVANSYGQKNELLLNDGQGGYTAATTGDRGDESMGAVALDADGDGDQDLFVANLEGKNELLLNDGTGGYTAVTTGDYEDYSTGAVALDADGDGDQDIFVANSKQKNELLLNDGLGNFTAVTTGDYEHDSYGAVAFDADGDGDQDIFVANSFEKNELLLNDGQGNFTAVTTGDAVNRTDVSLGAVALDADGDGDQDLFVANYGQNELLINQRAAHQVQNTSPPPSPRPVVFVIILVVPTLFGTLLGLFTCFAGTGVRRNK